MKRLFFILLIIYLTPAIGQDWNLDKVTFKGKVKHVLSSYKSLEYENDFEHVEVWFNQNGKLTKKSNYNEDWKETNLYNSEVLIYKKQAFCLTEFTIRNGDTIRYETYEYDTLNRVYKSLLYISGGLYNVTNYYYNLGNKLEKTVSQLQKQSDITFINTYKYDKNLNMIEDSRKSEGWNYVTTWDYSPENLLITETYTDDLRPIDSYIINYTYNNFNKVIREQKTNINGEHIYDRHLTYNFALDISEEYYITVEKDTLATYNHSYEYDSIGNWTRHQVTYNNFPYELTTRKIEYHY